MTGRKEFNEFLGRIITNRPFGDKFLGGPKEPETNWGVNLTPQEIGQLKKLTIADVTHIRAILGV